MFFLSVCLFVRLNERDLHQQQPAPITDKHWQNLICESDNERVPRSLARVLPFSLLHNNFILKSDYFHAFLAIDKQTILGRGTYAHKRECQDRN